jgi:hypothetical protein
MSFHKSAQQVEWFLPTTKILKNKTESGQSKSARGPSKPVHPLRSQAQLLRVLICILPEKKRLSLGKTPLFPVGTQVACMSVALKKDAYEHDHIELSGFSNFAKRRQADASILRDAFLRPTRASLHGRKCCGRGSARPPKHVIQSNAHTFDISRAATHRDHPLRLINTVSVKDPRGVAVPLF